MILFTSDLLFGSKILGAAKHAGLRGQGVRNRASLAQHAPTATHYFLDLEAELAEGESADELLDAALGHPHLCVFAFAGHVQADKLRAAQARLAQAAARRAEHGESAEGAESAESAESAAGAEGAQDDAPAQESPRHEIQPRHEVHSRGSLASRLHLILPPRTTEQA
jgi:hypothetical protein